MKNSVYLLVSLLLLIGCKNTTEEKVVPRVDTLPFYDDPAFTPKWISKDSDSLKNFHAIANFSLTDQEGKTITNATFANKIYITNFFFTTCPGICPKMATSMTTLQKEFLNNDGVELLSHTVTPETDSVSVLKSYATDNGVVPAKWHLVTGTRKEIYALGRKSYFVEEDLGKKKSEDDFLHTENFVLIDKSKHIRGIYNGLNPASMQELIADVKLLQKE